MNVVKRSVDATNARRATLSSERFDGRRCCRKLKHLFAHSTPKHNPVSAIWYYDGEWHGMAYRFMRSVYTVHAHAHTAFAKQLKMNFSIILFGDCVNARRTQLTPSNTRTSMYPHKKCERRRGIDPAHTHNDRLEKVKFEHEKDAKECYNLIGLNIHKLCCHVPRIIRSARTVCIVHVRRNTNDMAPPPNTEHCTLFFPFVGADAVLFEVCVCASLAFDFTE